MPLRRTKDLISWYTIAAVDTDVGTIYDFYFDDQQWVIRYIVVGTGVIFPGRKVLISPLALRYPAWSPMHIYVNLTREQIETSPSIDLHKPVSRRHEVEHHRHYGWPCYWLGAGTWGSWHTPKALADAAGADSKPEIEDASEDTHLRSTQEVTGYHIKATDGEIGHLEDFLFDDETWDIRYAIVDTQNWWPGKKVLLRPQWIKRVSWTDREIYADMAGKAIRMSPEWDPESPPSREYELSLHRHYGYSPYWTAYK